MSPDACQFAVRVRDPGSAARLGRLDLPHGAVDTPAFLPVGTQGSVKAVTPAQLVETGTRIILANTYHLALRPGAEVVEAAGGLHRFMGWDGPILTDSGGYQVFSLADLNRVDDDGVTFRSHIDGETIRLTPERAVELQNRLGADIAMAFDECPPSSASRERVATAVERTARWAERSLGAHRRPDQALFGIVQGGIHEDLRRRSAEQLTALDFPGYAIGGVSVGETPELMRVAVQVTAPLLPEDRPRYLMGVGEPRDIAEMVLLGVDLFDCVVPTRHARNAALFTERGLVKIRNVCHERAFEPVEDGCPCYTCRSFTRAYLRHLYLRREILASVLGSIHNLTYFQRLLDRLRRGIRDGRAAAVAREVRESFEGPEKR
ncbi:MAG: tRNA guanosine(34) transglycosylase Tgt [Planctomycetota bacterium]|nr:tRNA guanosine(34) transglycosylase Tgt [Planctomycetota bacterium]